MKFISQMIADYMKRGHGAWRGRVRSFVDYSNGCRKPVDISQENTSSPKNETGDVLGPGRIVSKGDYET